MFIVFQKLPFVVLEELLPAELYLFLRFKAITNVESAFIRGQESVEVADHVAHEANCEISGQELKG